MEINEKKLTEILKDQREEYQRYITIVFENFQSQVKVIGEQYGLIQERIDSIQEILNEHTEMIGSLQENMEIVKTDLNEHTKMITSIQERGELIKTDLEIIKNSLKKKVDIEEFVFLEKRVIVLENKLSRAGVS